MKTHNHPFAVIEGVGEHLSRGFNGAGGVTGRPKRVAEDRLDLVEPVRMIGCV